MKKRFYRNEDKKIILIFLIRELLKTLENRTPIDVEDDFLEELRGRDISDIFRKKDIRMFSSIEMKGFYYYLFNLFAKELPHSIIFENHPNSNVFPDKNVTEEPFIEVIESNDTICITVELRESINANIRLEIIQYILVINVNYEGKKNYKTVRLLFQVDTDSATANFLNGILNIELKKSNNWKKE